MDDSDILSFGHTGKISFKAALRSVRAHRPNFVTPIVLDSSSQSSDYSDSDESSHCRHRSRKRVRVHQVGGKSGSLASKLIHHQLEPYLISSDSDDSDEDSNTKKKIKKKTPSPLSSDISRSPSPEPSPPLLGQMITPIDQASKRALNKANTALQQLIFSSCTPGSDYSFCSDQNDSLLGSATKETFTLRVRYRGEIRRYTISKDDPLSLVCIQLALDVASGEGNKFLLSHKTITLSEKESPLTLGLTTADIIDAIQMSEAATKSTMASFTSSTIQIKVQSSNKAITYSLSKADPLKKAMVAFSAELDVPLSKLTFSFDGDPISPTQTAIDLDMEDGDCIDAM